MREFLGTVPKKWQLVETFWDCPEISESNKLQFDYSIDIALNTPIFPYSYVSPPCKNAVYGSLIGASQDSSIDEPCVNAPAAIIT